MNDTSEKIVEEVKGQQMGLKEKPTLEKPEGERVKKHREKVLFRKQDHS